MGAIVDTPELRKAIARAVLDDLEDRRGIGQELLGVRYDDPKVYKEIEESIADAVMSVLKRPPKQEQGSR